MKLPQEPPTLNTNNTTTPKPPASTQFRDSVLVQNKLAVLAVLFFVTGFLGLPLLWLCPRFTTAERWIWAVVNTIYTCTLIWIVIKICMWSWARISSAM